MPLSQAIGLARDEGLDLVEVSPTAEPPVCRIMDFGKYLFEQNKKAQQSRRKQKQVHVKEIKFRPGTDESDYQVKLRKLVEFLEQGDKTKVTLRFRGREMAHQELGAKLLARVRDDLDNFGVVEQMPQLEGRQMIMVRTRGQRRFARLRLYLRVISRPCQKRSLMKLRFREASLIQRRRKPTIHFRNLSTKS